MTECLGETMDSILSPEEVMTLVEEIVIEPHIGILLLSAQGLKDRLLISTNTGMIHIRLVGILHEEDTTDQTIETITNPQTVLITTTLEMVLYLPLGVVLRLEII